MQEDYYETFHDHWQKGTPFVQVTLVDTIGSTPQDQNAKMMVSKETLITGTVGGGRVENKAISHAQNLLRNKSKTDFVEWNLKKDVGMTCGGVVKLFFEVFHEAQWKIAIFGAGHVSQALVRTLLPLNCMVTCLDTRSEWLSRLPEHATLNKVHSSDLSKEISSIDKNSFLILMTQGHKTDVPILAEILKKPSFPFTGVIGSKSKANVMCEELLELGIERSRIKEFTCPIGLDLGNNSPQEIAVSITSQLLQVRDNKTQNN